MRYLERTFDTDLSLQYYDVMLHVSEREHGLRMTDLADALAVSKSGLTSLVDRMEREGLVARQPDPSDRRATRVVLTEQGQKRFSELSARHRETVRRVFTSRVSAEEATVIVDVLERVLRGLRE